MNTTVISTLEKTTPQELARAWENGFSDYAVRISMPPEVLQNVLRQNGVRLDLSVGAFNGGELVGFWINGVRKIDGVLTAYDSGTAISPKYRNLGISKMMADRSNEILKNAGVKKYILEVLQDNERAFEIYKKDGFEVTRELICFSKKCPFEKSDELPHDCRIQSVDIDTEFFENIPKMDYVPSWQNRVESALAISDKLIGIVASSAAGPLGYAILHKERGRLLQIGFSSEATGTPIPQAVIAKAASHCEAGNDLAIINVDKSASASCAIFKRLDFSVMAMQYEMKKDIG